MRREVPKTPPIGPLVLRPHLSESTTIAGSLPASGAELQKFTPVERGRPQRRLANSGDPSKNTAPATRRRCGGNRPLSAGLARIHEPTGHTVVTLEREHCPFIPCPPLDVGGRGAGAPGVSGAEITKTATLQTLLPGAIRVSLNPFSKPKR
ncbi:uncharacterized protein LOC120620408 isoform X1 [Pteropus medius]|uniref:uncharacterized protein LOC120620408 isoform X1 n=1 Tax=Pteropus vampyrus TaxID=132908 RepID=UPI00196A324E|nr:uncharacterized protein LOC120620408 isoform X1 [Pteropus giganteus]